MKKPKETVLYHGSLVELNSRDKDKQYVFAGGLSFTSKGYTHSYEIEKEREDSTINDEPIHNLGISVARKKILEEICKRGYDGLVNVRTLLYEDHMSDSKMAIEGTPILLKLK